MACRIGITTDVKARKAYWKAKYDSFKNWKILAGPMTRKEAQKTETALAKVQKCDAHPGGDNPNSGSSWYVYRFEF